MNAECSKGSRAQRARIMVQEQFATALNTAYARLKSHLDDEVQDLDQSIQVCR